MGEADIGRGMKEYGLSGSAEGLGGGGDAAKHAVFITDSFLCQAFHTVACVLPFYDFAVIFFSGIEIAEGRMLCTLYEMCIRDR